MRKAIIIGGGPAGISAALRLQQTTDIHCTIYELRPVPSTLGGAIAIPSNGLRLFDRLGVFAALCKRGNNEPTLTLHSINGGVIGRRDLVGSAEGKAGHGYMRIQRTDLMDVLLEAAKMEDISIHFGKKLVQICESASSITATFQDGTTDCADILLGCDGIHSAVRSLYVDPSQEPHYTGHAAVAAVVSINNSLSRYAESLSGLNAVFTSKGMFAAMPCSTAKDELLWFFSKDAPVPEAGDTRDGWEVQRNDEIANFKIELFDILSIGSGDFVEMLRAAIAATPLVDFYPIFQLDETVNWYKGRCLLLGDAAHAMPPSAGQGTSMALEDVFLLTRLLQSSDRPLQASFKAFERIRRPRVTKLGRLASRNAELRSSSSKLVLWIKEWVSWGMLRLPKRLQSIVLSDSQITYDIDDVNIDESF